MQALTTLRCKTQQVPRARTSCIRTTINTLYPISISIFSSMVPMYFWWCKLGEFAYVTYFTIMTCMSDLGVILSGEITYWSLLGLKRLKQLNNLGEWWKNYLKVAVTANFWTWNCLRKRRRLKAFNTYRPCLNFTIATGPWSLLSKSLNQKQRLEIQQMTEATKTPNDALITLEMITVYISVRHALGYAKAPLFLCLHLTGQKGTFTQTG